MNPLIIYNVFNLLGLLLTGVGAGLEWGLAAGLMMGGAVMLLVNGVTMLLMTRQG